MCARRLLRSRQTTSRVTQAPQAHPDGLLLAGLALEVVEEVGDGAADRHQVAGRNHDAQLDQRLNYLLIAQACKASHDVDGMLP